MRYNRFGDTGLEVSALCFGAMTIVDDPGLSRSVSPSLLRALERGVTIIDTARAYPGSEEIVRATLQDWRGRRPVISTKIAPAVTSGWHEVRPWEECFPTQAVRASVDSSLAALGTDVLDIVHLHQWWHLWVDAEPLFAVMRDLQREGKIRWLAISAGNHDHDAIIAPMQRTMIDSAQIILNLFESRPLDAALPIARSSGAGIIARCVFDNGGLTGTLTDKAFAESSTLRRAPIDFYRAKLERLGEAYIPAVAKSLKELALRFALSCPGVSTATVGMTDLSMVDECADIASMSLLDSEVVYDIRRWHVWTKNLYEGRS